MEQIENNQQDARLKYNHVNSNNVSNLYTPIKRQRLSDGLKNKTTHYATQTGFRKGRGTRDQIANICWIIEQENS